MPYSSNKELPPGVKNNLPEQAQEIYRKAFNNAWEQYKDKDNREQVAHKVAWSAVEKKYHKVGDKWEEL